MLMPRPRACKDPGFTSASGRPGLPTPRGALRPCGSHGSKCRQPAGLSVEADTSGALPHSAAGATSHLACIQQRQQVTAERCGTATGGHLRMWHCRGSDAIEIIHCT
jgi:hypothetical protein